jgi:hypothetical protein
VSLPTIGLTPFQDLAYLLDRAFRYLPARPDFAALGEAQVKAELTYGAFMVALCELERESWGRSDSTIDALPSGQGFEPRHDPQSRPEAAQLSSPRTEALPGADGFPCSKAELLRALGKDESHTKYLGQLIEAGKLVMENALQPVGFARYLARFRDQEEQARVIDAIMRGRRNN